MTTERMSLDRRHVLIVGAIAGVVAGMMMAMVEMLYGWLSDSHSIWDAPMGIWAWVAGIEHFGQPSNHVGPILLGLAGHMMNSMIIGVAFVALVLVLRVRGPVTTEMFGVAYGLVVWALMRYAILPLRTPEEQLFTSSFISPQWVWWLAHAILGMTLGVVTVLGLRGVTSEQATDSSSTYRHPHPAV